MYCVMLNMIMEKEEYLKRQREYRASNGNASTARYEKTKKGFLMRLYRNMKSRIAGIQKAKHHLYKDKDLLSKEDFYKWANSSEEFHSMFLVWEESKYNRKLTPTVDRIDPTLGYSKPNMRWLTHSENSRLGAISNQRLYTLNGNRPRGFLKK